MLPIVQLRAKVRTAKQLQALQHISGLSRDEGGHSHSADAARTSTLSGVVTTELESSGTPASCSVSVSSSNGGHAPQADEVGGECSAEDDGMCIICMEKPSDAVFEPCGHAIACSSCAARVVAKSSSCPMCRSLFHEHQPYSKVLAKSRQSPDT